MTPAEIKTALGSRLGTAGISGLQLLFPNVPADPDPPVKPYASVAFLSGGVLDGSLGGGWPVTNGSMIVVVVTEEGSGTVEGDGFVQAVAALFPRGLRLAVTGGFVEIHEQPQPKPGYLQGGAWRTPIEIPFRAL